MCAYTQIFWPNQTILQVLLSILHPELLEGKLQYRVLTGIWFRELVGQDWVEEDGQDPTTNTSCSHGISRTGYSDMWAPACRRAWFSHYMGMKLGWWQSSCLGVESGYFPSGAKKGFYKFMLTQHMPITLVFSSACSQTWRHGALLTSRRPSHHSSCEWTSRQTDHLAGLLLF